MLTRSFHLGSKFFVKKEVDPTELKGVLQQLKKNGVEAIAVCLLHSYEPEK
jgi:N-methylhydantoinase A/oxoprolinase/acetone carboxylase beta subunit